MACLHPVSEKDGSILTILVHIHCWDMDKKLLNSGYLDLFFKVAQGLRMLMDGLFALYFHKECLDLY